MSRLAKKPIAIPSAVTVDWNADTREMTIKGSKGSLSRVFRNEIAISVENNEVKLELVKSNVFSRSLWGTYASHITNMMHGVTEGFEKKLILAGVGFRWEVKGKNIEMKLGFSHPVIMDIPEGIEVSIEKDTMTIKGIDKELVGSFAAKVRGMKKPEPYKGKGIRYSDEIIRRKQGKKSA